MPRTLLLFLLLCGVAKAQLIDKPNIELITVADGLSSNMSTTLLQDRQGYIWIGSVDGLSRYDGYSFLKINHQPGKKNSLPNNTVYSLVEDSDGYIWMGQISGYVTRLNPRTLEVKSIQIPEGKNWDVGRVFADSQKRIWASVSGIGLFLLEGERFRFISPVPDLPQKAVREPNWYNSILSFYEASDHTIWLGTSNGLHQLNPIAQQIKKVTVFNENVNDPIPIQSIATIDGVTFWCGTYSNGLLRYNTQTGEWKRFLFQTGPPGTTNIVNKVVVRSDDELWVGTSGKGGGLFDIDEERFSFYYEPNDFDTGPICTDLIKDNTNAIWATTDLGLHHWSEHQNLFYFRKIPATRSDNGAYYGASSILEDEENHRLLIGMMFTEGLTIVDEEGRITTRGFSIHPKGEPFRLTTALLKDSHGTVWVVTRDGLYYLTPDNQLIHEPSILKTLPADVVPNFGNIVETKTGDLWVSSVRNGLFRREKGSRVWKRYTAETPGTLLNNRIIRFLEDAEGQLWAVHAIGGITRFNPATNEYMYFRSNPADSSALVSQRIADITKTPRGEIWVATIEGLSQFRYAEKNFKNYTIDQGLASNNIYSLRGDDDNNLWMATSLGISVLIDKDKSVRKYSYIDGLKGTSMGFSLRRGSDGKMFILTYQGYYTFNPRSVIEQKPSQAPMVITGVRHNNEAITDFLETGNVGLNYQSNSVTIEFAALNFLNPSQNRYAYMMEGLDNNWNETSDHLVTYSGMPSGSYLFRVKNLVDEKEAQLRVVVSTPFWRQRWFVAFWLLALVVTGYLLYRFREKKIREEEEEKSRFKQRLAEVEMKALRAQMSPHFIFNSLNSINKYIVKSEPEKASLYLTRFSKLMRLILDNSNHKIISLEQELAALQLYIQLESLRFNEKFSYKVEVAPDLVPISIGVPPMIIQPFVENAIWHGLLHKDTTGLLTVKIERYQEGLQCIIEDNGIGRKRAKELKSKSISEEKSYGMKITADRLNMLNVNSTISSIEIIDLEDAQGQPAGTKVIVRIMTAELEPEF